MLDSRHGINLSRLPIEPPGPPNSSRASWTAGGWWRRPGMFENLRFLFQHISVVVQRFNSVFLHDGFIKE